MEMGRVAKNDGRIVEIRLELGGVNNLKGWRG